jgi:hypothetical protein
MKHKALKTALAALLVAIVSSVQQYLAAPEETPAPVGDVPAAPADAGAQ